MNDAPMLRPPPTGLVLLPLIAFLAYGGVAACGREPDGEGAESRAASRAPEPPRADPRHAIYAAADRRELAPEVLQGLASTDPTIALAAMETIARLRDPECSAYLLEGLRHPDTRVRLAASFGLSLLELTSALNRGPGRRQGETPHGPSDREVAVLGAAAAAMAGPGPDRDAEVAAHVRDLGRLGAARSMPALRAALDHDSPEVRQAAADALASYGRRRVPVNDDLHGALLEHVRDDPDPSVREGAARALGTLLPPIPAALREEIRRGLLAALGPERTSASVAALVARALPLYPPVPPERAAALATHNDPSLALEGIRLLAGLGPTGEAALAIALTTLADRAVVGGRSERTLLADALPLAFPAARYALVHGAAQRLYARLGALPSPGLPEALAHCAAAELVDRGKGWPAKTTRCGLGAAPAHLGARRTAAILGDVAGEDVLRATFLGRLYREGPDAVRAAAVEALVGLPYTHARPLLVEGLGGRDVGVASAALRAVLHHRGTIPAAGDGPALFRPLSVARATMRAAADAPGLALVAEALAAVPDARHAELLRELSADSSRAVRDAARRALEAFPDTAPASTYPPPQDAADEEILATRPPSRLYRVHSTAGAFDLELDPDAAPVTTARFQDLVARGFYEGLVFHSRVPGFVVQGGDPRGDGHGGPGFAVRDEPSRTRFERGSVGLALAGADTGGSQFFVTLADQPQLEGRYTAFARVVAGLEVVDRILPGDTIERTEPLRQ